MAYCEIYTGGDRGAGRRHRPQLEGMICDTELDDFFRKAGGLKSELATVVRSLGMPSLIYSEELMALRVRVKLLVGSCKVESILAVQAATKMWNCSLIRNKLYIQVFSLN